MAEPGLLKIKRSLDPSHKVFVGLETMAADGLILDLASKLELKELQSLAQVSRDWRRAVQALPARAWQHSAALTLPVWHPLAAATADVPAAANRLCSANAALRQGRISGQPLELAGADALLLQPDFARAILVRNDNRIEVVETQQLLRRSAKRPRSLHATQLPGTSCHFTFAGRDCSSPCGGFCLLCVHHDHTASGLAIQALTELVVWDVAAGAVAGVLHSQASSGGCGHDDLKAWTWLPDSTIFLSDNAGGQVCVYSPHAQLLGSAEVDFCEDYEPQDPDIEWRPEHFVASPAGTFLAGQSGVCLTILTVPQCAVHFELELEPEFSRILDEPGVQPHAQQLHWSPDGELVLYCAYDLEAFLLCSIRTRGWAQVLSSLFEGPSTEVTAWLPRGALGMFTTEEPHPFIFKVELAFGDPLDASSSVQPIGSSLPDFKGLMWSKDFRWIAADTGEGSDSTIKILSVSTLQVAAQWQVDGVAAPMAAFVWARSGAALVTLDEQARPMQLLNFA